MKPLRATLAAAAVVLSGCGGSNSPILDRVGEGRIATRVGPGGALIRGDGGTALAGFELEIPRGALDRLVELTVEGGDEIPFAGTTAASVALRIVLRPDPGPLLASARMRVAVDLPPFRRPDDLVVVSRRPAGIPSAVDPGLPRYGVAADQGEYSRAQESFTFAVRTLTDVQARLAARPRQTDDAIELVAIGYDALLEGTDQSLRRADLAFAEAQAADPFMPLGHLLRAVSRVLVAINDRTDLGPGLDSVGDVLRAVGFDVDRSSLLGRALADLWPRSVVVPAGAPAGGEVVAALRQHLRPVLELALRDLDSVPLDTVVEIELPPVVAGLPGTRELDAADLIMYRALLSTAAFALDWLTTVDLDGDARTPSSPLRGDDSLAVLLGREPSVGTLRARPGARTLAAWQAASSQWSQGFGALDAEQDDQGDDLVVFADAMRGVRRDRWLANLRALADSANGGGAAQVTLDGGRGALRIDALVPWTGTGLAPRSLLPSLHHWLPVAGTLPDPTFAGALPDADQDSMTELAGLVGEHALPAAVIVADGRFGDWPASASALSPPDPRGDDLGRHAAVDLAAVFLADSGDDLAFRWSVHADTIGLRPEQSTFYGVEIRDLGPRGLRRRIVIEVRLADGATEVVVARDGVVRSVAVGVAFGGSDLELVVDRYDLFDPDDPIVERHVRFFAEALDLQGGTRGYDRTRAIVTRF